MRKVYEYQCGGCGKKWAGDEKFTEICCGTLWHWELTPVAGDCTYQMDSPSVEPDKSVACAECWDEKVERSEEFEERDAMSVFYDHLAALLTRLLIKIADGDYFGGHKKAVHREMEYLCSCVYKQKDRHRAK